MSKVHFVNKITFAAIIGESERMVTRYIGEGMPVTGAGKKGQPLQINAPEAIAWWFERKAKSLGYATGGTGDEEDLDMFGARRMVYIEQHRKLKIENDLSEEKLIPADQVELIACNAVTSLAAQLDGIAGRVASGDAVLRQKLLDEHRRIRASYSHALTDLADLAEGGGPDDATAEAGGMEVGG